MHVLEFNFQYLQSFAERLSKFVLYVIVIAVSIEAKSQIWQPPQGIREIPVPTLPDIAVAAFDAYGPVIYFNPNVCQAAGPLVTAFYQAHEYGHHFLGHVINSQNPYMRVWLTMNAEDQADQYAVRHWFQNNRLDIIRSAAQSMWQINNQGDLTHRPSRVRAMNISSYYSQLSGSRLFP
jgi:hypothetical protein